MEEQEEARKIQFTGKSSYIVSLPKSWINEMGLKRGDQVRMHRQGTNEIIVSPQKLRIRKMTNDEAIIEISADENVGSVARKIISLYFMGFNTIAIKPKDGRLGSSHKGGHDMGFLKKFMMENAGAAAVKRLVARFGDLL